MTKRRAPLSYELALTKVASLLGWPACALTLGQSERTVRNWSDPDASAGIRMDAAETLDLAYQEAGGVGAPFLECYATRLKTGLADGLGSAEAIAAAAAAAAKEGGEAVAAAIIAARPDASDQDFVIAEKELEEAISAKNAALAAIRQRRRAEMNLTGAHQP